MSAQVSAPRISPDGRRVLYTYTHIAKVTTPTLLHGERDTTAPSGRA